MNRKQIEKQLENILERYRLGLINRERADLEKSIINDILQVTQLADLEARLDRLEKACRKAGVL